MKTKTILLAMAVMLALSSITVAQIRTGSVRLDVLAAVASLAEPAEVAGWLRTPHAAQVAGSELAQHQRARALYGARHTGDDARLDGPRVASGARDSLGGRIPLVIALPKGTGG